MDLRLWICVYGSSLALGVVVGLIASLALLLYWLPHNCPMPPGMSYSTPAVRVCGVSAPCAHNTTVGAGSTVNPSFEADFLHDLSEGGYADAQSVLPGQDITFYLGSTNPTTDVDLYRECLCENKHLWQCILTSTFRDQVLRQDNHQYIIIHRYHSIPTTHPQSACSPFTGCRWSPSMVMTIPQDLPSGVYFLQYHAAITAAHSSIRRVYFLVGCSPTRAKSQGSVLNVVNAFTGQIGYNAYGGASLYHSCHGDPTIWTEQTCTSGRGMNGEGSSATVSSRRPVMCPSNSYQRTLEVGTVPCLNPFSCSCNHDMLERLLSAENMSPWSPDDLCLVSMADLTHMPTKYMQSFAGVVITGKQEYFDVNVLSMLKEYVTRGGLLYNAGYEFGWELLKSHGNGMYSSQWNILDYLGNTPEAMCQL